MRAGRGQSGRARLGGAGKVVSDNPQLTQQQQIFPQLTQQQIPPINTRMVSVLLAPEYKETEGRAAAAVSRAWGKAAGGGGQPTGPATAVIWRAAHAQPPTPAVAQPLTQQDGSKELEYGGNEHRLQQGGVLGSGCG